MKKIYRYLLFLVGLSVFSYQTVFASSFMECDVLAVVSGIEVTNVESKNGAPLKIIISETRPADIGTHDGCDFKGSERSVFAETGSTDLLSKISVGALLLMKYSHYSGMGSDGVVEGETWQVLRILELTDVLDAFDENGQPHVGFDPK